MLRFLTGTHSTKLLHHWMIQAILYSRCRRQDAGFLTWVLRVSTILLQAVHCFPSSVCRAPFLYCVAKRTIILDTSRYSMILYTVLLYISVYLCMVEAVPWICLNMFDRQRHSGQDGQYFLKVRKHKEFRVHPNVVSRFRCSWWFMFSEFYFSWLFIYFILHLRIDWQSRYLTEAMIPWKKCGLATLGQTPRHSLH